MPPKSNPLRLNPLQLKTLVLLQEIARHPGFASPAAEGGDIVIRSLPHAHGDHFHIGDAVVSGKDATGLHNRAVWLALARKGLVREGQEGGLGLTAEGQGYDTGIADQVLHRADH